MLSMGLSLRRILGVFIALLGTAAVVACLSLVVLTTLIHESSKSLESALQGLRLAEKAQIELLLADRTGETAEREAIIAELRQSLNALGGYSTGTQEAEALPRAVSSVEGYLAMLPGAQRGSPDRLRSLAAARAALGDLVGINVQQARAAQDQAGRWDRLADGIGLGAVAFVLAAAAFLIWYVGSQALRPILALAEVIERFGRGQLAERAPERGPTELRQIALRFNAMAECLADQREARLAFLAGVAHDLRSPLSALGLQLELLQPHAALSPDQWHQILDRARRQMLRLEHMTADLLERAQIESGRFELSLDTVDVRELVVHVTDTFAALSPCHQLELSVPHRTVWLRCDPLRLDRVLTNLLSNAVKYSPGGGRVRVSVDGNGASVALSVSDEGVGMSAEERRRIFEPFYRGARLRQAVPGTGLGLSTVRRIVEAHGGEIKVRSEPGRGSTFEVRLPGVVSAIASPTEVPEEIGNLRR